MRASYNQTSEANKNEISILKELVAAQDRDLEIQADKAASDICTLQTKNDELQKSLDGAQDDLKAETLLKNQKNEVILETWANLEKRQKEHNHEVKSRLKNIKERDAAVNELKNAKTKLEDFEQQMKEAKETIEDLRKKNEEQNAQLSNAVEYRHDAKGKENFM